MNECSKSQSVDPSKEDHSLFFSESGLRIYLDLKGTFSSFKTRKPIDDELEHCDKIFITPDSTLWDPYSSHFADNEEAMIDSDFAIVEHPNKKTYVLQDNDAEYMDLPSVDAVEQAVDDIIYNAMDGELTQIESFHDNNSIAFHEAKAFAETLSASALRGKISFSIGSVTICDEPCPLFTSTLDELGSLFHLEISSLELEKTQGVTPEFLSKIWSVSKENAQDILNANINN